MAKRKNGTARPVKNNPYQPDSAQYEEFVAEVGSKQPKRMESEDLVPDRLNASLQTTREVKRDEQITLLLTNYVDTYVQRQKRNRCYRSVLFWVCVSATAAFVLLSVTCLGYGMICTNRTVKDIAALVTVALSAIGSIAFLLEIVAKYVFPLNEEEHIAIMVQAIQKNDLQERTLRYEHPNVCGIMRDETKQSNESKIAGE